MHRGCIVTLCSPFYLIIKLEYRCFERKKRACTLPLSSPKQERSRQGTAPSARLALNNHHGTTNEPRHRSSRIVTAPRPARRISECVVASSRTNKPRALLRPNPCCSRKPRPPQPAEPSVGVGGWFLYVFPYTIIIKSKLIRK